jgi:hypothetical protein
VAAPRALRPASVAVEPNAPLELPEDLVLVGRWRNPTVLLRQLEGWAGGDLSFELWLRGRIGQPSYPVDLTAPVELLAVLDRQTDPPGLAWALSLGLDVPASSAAHAAARSARDVESPSGLACAEQGSLGSAPLRMVCAASDDHLARLLRHATHALPLTPLSRADMALLVRAEPLRAIDDPAIHSLVSSWLSKVLDVSAMNEPFAIQWASALESVTAELRNLADDLDGSSVEFSLRSEQQTLELSVLAPAAAGRSALGQLLVGSGATGIAPAEFWHAHEASEDAGFIWAFESTPLARLRKPVGALLGTVLDFRGVPERLARQARLLVEDLPLPRGPVIHASGRLPAVAGTVVARAPWLDELGWQLLNVRGAFAEYRFYVSALVDAFNDPILGPQFGRLLRGALGPEWAPLRMKQRRPRRAAELPRDSFVLEVTFASASAVSPSVASPGTAADDILVRSAPLPTLFAVFAPDDDGVKVAWGGDEAFLVSVVSQPQTNKAAATLASRAGLGSLHEQRTLAGGFYSLAALAELDGSLLPRIGPWERRGKSVAEAPHRGLSPIVYTVSQPFAATTLSLSASLGRDTVEDLLFLISEGASHR